MSGFAELNILKMKIRLTSAHSKTFLPDKEVSINEIAKGFANSDHYKNVRFGQSYRPALNRYLAVEYNRLLPQDVVAGHPLFTKLAIAIAKAEN